MHRQALVFELERAKAVSAIFWTTGSSHVLLTDHSGQKRAAGEDMDSGALGQEAQQGADFPDEHQHVRR